MKRGLMNLFKNDDYSSNVGPPSLLIHKTFRESHTYAAHDEFNVGFIQFRDILVSVYVSSQIATQVRRKAESFCKIITKLDRRSRDAYCIGVTLLLRDILAISFRRIYLSEVDSNVLSRIRRVEGE